MVALLEPLEPPAAPVEAADALRRIAFLLERTRAGTYRVEAFRKPSAWSRATEPPSCASGPRRARSRTSPASGSPRAGSSREALAGELPAYLGSLQDKAASP